MSCAPPHPVETGAGQPSGRAVHAPTRPDQSPGGHAPGSQGNSLRVWPALRRPPVQKALQAARRSLITLPMSYLFTVSEKNRLYPDPIHSLCSSVSQTQESRYTPAPSTITPFLFASTMGAFGGPGTSELHSPTGLLVTFRERVGPNTGKGGDGFPLRSVTCPWASVPCDLGLS